MIREEVKEHVKQFIANNGNSKSIMKINVESAREIILYYQTHTEEEFRKEYPFNKWTYDEMQYVLKCYRKAYRNANK